MRAFMGVTGLKPKRIAHERRVAAAAQKKTEAAAA
jgi:hypothetical protein